MRVPDYKDVRELIVEFDKMKRAYLHSLDRGIPTEGSKEWESATYCWVEDGEWVSWLDEEMRRRGLRFE